MTQRTRPVSAFTAALTLLASGCLSPTRGDVADTATGDEVVDAAADTRAPDTARPDATSDAAERPDTGLPTFACECDGDEVYRHGPCVPTLDLGCGPACASDDDCGDALVCDDCAASTACGTRDCRPACAVPDAPHALVPEPLRAEPTRVRPGGRVTISGTSFYIGALGHSVRLGDDVIVEFGSFGGGSACEAAVAIPEETTPGTHALWVSQYTGAEPWVLAGVLHVGEAAVDCVQPGFPCDGAADCCTAPGVSLTCTSGRCRRATAP